ncbi:hypothetical protein BO82DRAFT_121948 [Aspergillus uvarum CBS 121591]|uniref:Uncharacterized protein n=1 Tax=Aspergillus uvarum CBS 121591 TaxID=1448315 RepID=A0A319C486_9EURO|nr:hypothetical protein BO82DRAFT_121948 [Aspergillus uvarum CBS 121591]PYH79954.1 hypothetical protein BO82DRAFT_121948 [Aspergillus uvarum CBS 121591]
MVQGSLKKTKPSGGSTSKRPTALAPKRGPRQIAPKKASLIKQQKLTKVRRRPSELDSVTEDPDPNPPPVPETKHGATNPSPATQKLTAGLTARTEKNLAERAGHLELLAGGKKDKKADAAKGKK